MTTNRRWWFHVPEDSSWLLVKKPLIILYKYYTSTIYIYSTYYTHIYIVHRCTYYIHLLRRLNEHDNGACKFTGWFFKHHVKTNASQMIRQFVSSCVWLYIWKDSARIHYTVLINYRIMGIIRFYLIFSSHPYTIRPNS